MLSARATGAKDAPRVCGKVEREVLAVDDTGAQVRAVRVHRRAHALVRRVRLRLLLRAAAAHTTLYCTT